MTDSTVDALTAASALDGTEEYYAVQGGADRKVTGAQIKTLTSASPSLVTPALGTPTSGTLTNCTGLPAVGGGTGQSTYTKGDLLASPGSNTLNKLAVGADATVLTADAASTNGVKWAAAGGGMSISGTVTSGTTGSVLFVGTGPILSQDNTKFFWDDTNFILKAGAEIDLLANGAFVKAMFPVYNVTGNNWFLGQAGNTTLTGYLNFGMGSGALSSVSTGVRNTAIGNSALGLLTTGNTNVGIGDRAGSNITGGGKNVAIGDSSLLTATTGTSVAIGAEALKSITTSTQCVAIGPFALSNLVDPSDFNTAIGYAAGNNLSVGIENTLVGFIAGNGNTAGDRNTLIGAYSAAPMSSGTANTMLGHAAGYSVTSGSFNTLLGTWRGPSSAMSSVIALSDGNIPSGPQLDYGYTNAATWTSPSAICVTPVAVASLPAPGIMGRRHFVTNATATTFASIVAGGGGNPVPVYDDGTNWRIG